MSRSDDHDAAIQELERDAHASWLARNRAVVAELRQAGHFLHIHTSFSASAGADGSFRTTVLCTQCEARYRGRLLGRRRGLPPRRPCPGKVLSDSTS